MKFIALLTFSLLLMPIASYSDHHEMESGAIESTSRSPENRDRDTDRRPAQVLDFIGLAPGDTVLDWGAGGGYWAELFATQVGDTGRVYAQQRAGERFESRKDALVAQFEPFGNIDLMPLANAEPIPLGDDSVDTIMLSYLYHHMHYAESTGESLPESTADLFGEFRRVLKPGGTIVVIEHQAAEGSSRAESANWHRTPAETAKSDFTSAGFEIVGEAPDIYRNSEDDQKNMWGQTGLRGKTTSFVHKYRSPD